MDSVPVPVPFGQRLETLLREHNPRLSQAKLAKKSGVDASLISRIMQGERDATSDVLHCLAPVLGVDAATLVAGTDAEQRLGERSRSQEEQALALQRMVESEGRARALEEQLEATREVLHSEQKRRTQAETTISALQFELERTQRDLGVARANIQREEQERRRFQEGLSRAVAAYTTLQSQCEELKKELSSTKMSSRAAAILSAVSAGAAATSVALLAYFMRENDGGKQPPNPDREDAKSRKNKK